MNYLLDNYPNETSSIEKRFEKETPMSLVMATALSSKEEEELSVSEDEQSCATETSKASNETNKESSNPRPKKRRESICAEKVSEDEDKSDTDVLLPHDKTDDQMRRIREILLGNVFFSHLNEQQMKAVQDAMFLIEHVDGDVIITQGDEEAKNFYCIDSGCVDIFINVGEERKLVKACQAGDSFGELALLYGAPRAASCIAKGDVKLWTLNRVNFKRILMKTTIEVRNANKKFLQLVSLFANLDEYELMTISDALRAETFEDNEAICTEGDAGTKFFLIKEGTAICTKRQSDGSVQEINRLSCGDFFGEIALLTDKPRQASVLAEGKLSCLSIQRDTFTRLLCVKELLARNLGTYNI